jgi:ferredoxin
MVGEKTPETAIVRVKEGGEIREIKVKTGRSLRDILIENGINPYQSIARYTNCKGKQLCGTCIVDVTSNSLNCNRKSLDEAAALRENADSYRLSCVTFVYGDVDVEVRPPVNPSQWTR